MKEARKLIDQGMYTQSMMTLGKLLESLYTDFYQDLLASLPPAQRKIISEREAAFASPSEKSAREQGFAGLSLGGKAKFFYDNAVVGQAEQLLKRKFPQFSLRHQHYHWPVLHGSQLPTLDECCTDPCRYCA